MGEIMKSNREEKTSTLNQGRPPHRGLSRNGVKNYSKGPCVTILE